MAKGALLETAEVEIFRIAIWHNSRQFKNLFSIKLLPSKKA
jgi:hypothetical protein